MAGASRLASRQFRSSRALRRRRARQPASRPRRRASPARQARRRDRRSGSAATRCGRWRSSRRRRSRDGADTLITCGGVQSNHARVTAITAAKLGLRCILVVNGRRPARSPDRQRAPRRAAGAEVRYVPTRDGARSGDGRRGSRGAAERRPTVRDPARRVDAARRRRVRISGRRAARADRSARRHRPRDLVGRHAGRARRRLPSRRPATRASSASAPTIRRRRSSATIRTLLAGLASLLGVDPTRFDAAVSMSTTRSSARATACRPSLARSDGARSRGRRGSFLDPTYTAKAMAGLIAHVRAGAFKGDQTVLFWHTGGQVGSVRVNARTSRRRLPRDGL